MKAFPKLFMESFPEDPIELSVLFCKKFGIFEKGDRVGVGVSGGRDSVFLLHMLSLFRSRFGISKTVCLHFNHGTRGGESDRDEKFVRSLCEEMKVDLVCKRSEVRLASEDEMRKERYKFFSEAAQELSLTKIATAHNLDDLFESFLLNLKKGGGFMSAIGIYPVNYNLCTIPVVRPILPIRKSSITKYLKSKNIKYVEDTTNLDIKILRNRIRMILNLMLPEDVYNSIISGFFRFWLNFYSICEFLADTFEKNPEELPVVIRKQIELYRKSDRFSFEDLKRSFTKDR